MINQAVPPVQENQTICKSTTFSYLAAGLGLGAMLGVFFASKSGEETRKMIADKCLDAIDTANHKVQESRVHVKEVLDRGQQQVTNAVAAARKAVDAPKANAS